MPFTMLCVQQYGGHRSVHTLNTTAPNVEKDEGGGRREDMKINKTHVWLAAMKVDNEL